MRIWRVLVLLSYVTGCSSDDGGGLFDPTSQDSTTTPTTGGSESSGRDSPADTTSTTAMAEDSGSTSGSSDDAGFKFDVPATTGLTDGEQGMGCEKVDLLFVIDDSGSMRDEQDLLTAAFPQMAQTIDETLVAQQGIDYRIGVISSNITDDTMCILGMCGPNYLGRLQHTEARIPCSNEPAGRWIEGSEGAAAVSDQFTCIASLRQAQDFNGFPEGGSEAPLEATRMALVDRVSDAEQYNSGFLRDDALLVLVIVTDEDDQSVWEGATSWSIPLGGPGTISPVSQFFDMLVALKGGHPENLTAIAISGPAVGGGDTTSPRIHAFLNLAAPNAYWTDISGNDYSQPLQEALEVIEGSCEGFILPQG